MQKLITKDFKSLRVPATIRQAVEIGEPLRMVEKVTGSETILMALEIELAKVAAMLNIDSRLNLQNHQVPVIAKSLFETFKNESLEDFMLCFQRGSNGLYDDKLLRLDGAIITGWMRRYLEEKYNEVEIKLMEEKEEFHKRFEGVSDEFFDAWKESLGYDPTKGKKENNAHENNYQKIRLDLSLSQDLRKKDFIDREVHKIYLLENFNPKTAAKRDEWIPEDQWLVLNEERAIESILKR